MSAIDAGGSRGSRAGSRAAAPQSRPRTHPGSRPDRSSRTGVRQITRTRALGRTASLANGVVVLLIGIVAFAIVALQVGVVRANMDTATVQSRVRATQVHISDVQNDIATQLSDGRIDSTARASGMVIPPADAIRSVPVRLRAGKRSVAR